jgi:hypothetical protein
VNDQQIDHKQRADQEAARKRNPDVGDIHGARKEDREINQRDKTAEILVHHRPDPLVHLCQGARKHQYHTQYQQGDGQLQREKKFNDHIHEPES